MKIDVLRQPLMVTLILFMVLTALFAYRFHVLPYPEELPFCGTAPVGNLLAGVGSQLPVVAISISIIVIFSNGISISRILSRHMVLSSRSYLPMILYLLISCGVWFSAISLPAVISSLLILRGSEHFISSFVHKASFNQTFRGGLLMGCVPVIYPPASIYLLAIPVATALFRRRWRETAVALIGGLLPLLAYAYVMWALDFGFVQSLVNIRESIFTTGSGFTVGAGSIPGVLRLITAILTGVLLLAGVSCFVMISGTMRTRARAIFGYFIILLLIGGSQLFIPGADPSSLALFAIPVSAIIPMFFARYPGLVSGIGYIAFVVGFAALNIYPLLFA